MTKPHGLSLGKQDFSKYQLLAFVAAFALIGTYVLFHSLAAPNTNLAGDLNNDNTVNLLDLSILISDYGTTNAAADINGDGHVNLLDLSALITNYGQTYSGGGSCPSGNTNWCNATNFATPSFTPTRTVNVTSQSAFNTAWNNIQAGDQINVSGVTFTGEVNLTGKQLSNWAQISFDANTKFVGVSGATNDPAVYFQNTSHIRLYGGDISDSASGGQAGNGILVHGNTTYVSWWNFVIHDVGNTGLGVFPAEADSNNLDFKGEIYNWGQNLAWDPHSEIGTGEHGANLSDANYSLTNSRFALYVHDGPTGAGIEMGSETATSVSNTIYVWCQNLTFDAQVQVAANCFQFWGVGSTNNTIQYLEAENLQGRPFDTNTATNLSSNTLVYGRATNTNLNPKMAGSEGLAQNIHWDTRGGTVIQDVSPTP